MPEPDGRLTEAENTQVTQWFQDHWKFQPKCPISGDNNWRIGERVVDLVSHQEVSIALTYPKVPVMCMTCGYTLLFNAVVMGIVEEVEEAPSG